MSKLYLKSTGESVSLVPSIAQVPDKYEYRVPHGKRPSTAPKPVLTGKNTTPRAVVTKPMVDHVHAIIHHRDGRDEYAVVKRSNLVKREGKHA